MRNPRKVIIQSALLHGVGFAAGICIIERIMHPAEPLNVGVAFLLFGGAAAASAAVRTLKYLAVRSECRSRGIEGPDLLG